jgi:glycosyltransferase involved in cell wall biosynthesis
MLVTIFTPTYNRAYRLPDLYRSLCEQTCKDFEWVVVDDGSTDDTEQLFNEWVSESSFDIKYIKQANGGKHRAINQGVKEAKGEYFFIVDSDDCLTDDAVEQIHTLATTVNRSPLLCGMCFRRLDVNSREIIGTPFHEDGMQASSLEWTYKYHVGGDKSEVVKTKIMKQYPFPEFDGENFVPEALIWNRIADSYRMICKNTGIYLCEYLPDGLSAGFKRNLRRNPKGFGAFYRETMNRHISVKETLKCFLRCLQCGWYSFQKSHNL